MIHRAPPSNNGEVMLLVPRANLRGDTIRHQKTRNCTHTVEPCEKAIGAHREGGISRVPNERRGLTVTAPSSLTSSPSPTTSQRTDLSTLPRARQAGMSRYLPDWPSWTQDELSSAYMSFMAWQSTKKNWHTAPGAGPSGSRSHDDEQELNIDTAVSCLSF